MGNEGDEKNDNNKKNDGAVQPFFTSLRNAVAISWWWIEKFKASFAWPDRDCVPDYREDRYSDTSLERWRAHKVPTRAVFCVCVWERDCLPCREDDYIIHRLPSIKTPSLFHILIQASGSWIEEWALVIQEHTNSLNISKHNQLPAIQAKVGR